MRHLVDLKAMSNLAMRIAEPLYAYFLTREKTWT